MKNETIKKDLEIILKSVAISENFKNYEVFSKNYQTKGEGFLSEFFTGEVLNKDTDQTIQVAIKKAPLDGFSVVFGNENVYKNEIHFYSEVFPELDKFQREKEVKLSFNHIPRYLTGSLEATNMFVAMENLKAAGYVLSERKKFLDSEHLELIFKTYGEFHALSFVFKQENSERYANLVNSFTKIAEKITEHSEMANFMEKGYLTALETFDPITEADILAKLKAIDIRETIKSVQTYEGCYKCLIHGDCWSNNMLFKYKETGELEDIKLIDFQVAFSSTPIHDLSYFFYSGASKEDMDKLDYYLDMYYQSFSNFSRELGGNPEEILPLDIFKKEWKHYGVWGIFLGCQLWLVKLMNQEELEIMVEQPNITETEYWELWDEKTSKICEDADYRERARNICIHAVEYGII